MGDEISFVQIPGEEICEEYSMVDQWKKESFLQWKCLFEKE